MSHRIRQGSLQELLVANACGECVIAEICGQRFERAVETPYFLPQRRQSRRLELTTVKHCAGVSNQPGHVPQQFVWRPRSGRSSIVSEAGWRVTKRLLGAIGQSGEEVTKQSAGFIHRDNRSSSGNRWHS